MFTKNEFYKTIAPKLKQSLKIKNVYAVPRLKKITINVGIGTLSHNNKNMATEVSDNIKLMTGQKPVITKAKKAISNFKTREGMPVGVIVTLRGQRMYDFFGKLINAVFPRIRDFRGFSMKSFDGHGNLSIAIKEHTVFPEVNPEDIVTVHGVQINIETSSKNNEDAIELLKEYNFPFEKKTNK